MKKKNQQPRHPMIMAALCEALLAQGHKPSRDQHDELLAGIRGVGSVNWDAVPLTRTWFTQIP